MPSVTLSPGLERPPVKSNRWVRLLGEIASRLTNASAAILDRTLAQVPGQLGQAFELQTCQLRWTGDELSPMLWSSGTPPPPLVGPTAQLTLPIGAGGALFGTLTLSRANRVPRWSADELSAWRFVAELIGQARARQRAELRWEKLRAEQAREARLLTLGELASTFAQELHPSLTAILSGAQSARRLAECEGADRGELCRLLDGLVREHQRISAVVGQMRASVSKSPDPRETCDLHGLIREVYDSVAGEMAAGRIAVQLRLQAAVHAVEVCRTELQQVVLNLLTNAAEAVAALPLKRRRIVLVTQQIGAEIVVEVRDQGPGFPEEKAATLFEPFFTTKLAGLGMGLAVCQRIVEAHGGVLQARNEPQGGACFWFRLPLVDLPTAGHRPLPI